ncbi:hypothetical protein HPB50_004481 [Hyalomma asiaticum]|uniref:Uncharacterized protein n=1 Tax=Hyalomma asiaticum TaxID=266040 RepID=A0ACB7SBF9_HYAAI|nr:hypothetical protein HPB50_004481 [Hyalomma asiaticum]
MDRRSSEGKLKQATTEPDATPSQSRQGARKALIRGRDVADEAFNTRPRKASAAGSSTSVASSAASSTSGSRASDKRRSKEQLVKEASTPATTPLSGPSSLPVTAGPGISSSTTTVVHQAAVSSVPPQEEDVQAHSASAASHAGALALPPGAVSSASISSVDTADPQATSLRSRPDHDSAGSVDTARPGRPGRASAPGIGRGPSVASRSPTIGGDANRDLSLCSSSQLPGSPLAEVSALLRLNTGVASAAASDSPSGQSSVRLQVVLTPSTTGLQRKQRKQHVPYRYNEDFIGMQRLYAQSTRRTEDDANKSERLFLLLPVVSLLVLVFLASIAYLMMNRQQMDEKTTDERFCTSAGCVDHADIIGLSEDRHQSSPCDEFGRFICSVWERRHQEKVERKHVTRSVMTDAVMDHLVSLEKFSGQQHKLEISQRPARMMNACLLKRPSDDRKALNQLLDFMHRTGFGFPEDEIDKSNYSRPLNMLVDLSYNWALPLWFFVDIVVPRNSTASHMVVTLRHSSLGDFYNTLQEAIEIYEEVYSFYVHTLIEVIYGDTVGPSFKRFIKESKQLQKHVFGNLSWLSRSYHNPILLTVKRLPHFVVKTSGRTLARWPEAFERF